MPCRPGFNPEAVTSICTPFANCVNVAVPILAPFSLIMSLIIGFTAPDDSLADVVVILPMVSWASQPDAIMSTTIIAINVTCLNFINTLQIN
ncbi:hypothetical protein D3C80_1849090 [compost metagenome]